MAPSGAVAVFTALLITSAIGQEIAESPSDVTVFTNQTAVFTCVIHGPFAYQYWRVNGIGLNTLPSDIRHDLDNDQETVGEDEEFTLTITAKAEYNGTRVQCVTGGGGDERESENATLNIQGPLSSVGDLETDSSTSSIIISWTAPFSLNVTDGDPKVYYSVLINNETDETAVSVPYPNCINISETFCVFRPDHLSPCHKYNFTVIPYNGAGQGQNVSAISTGKPNVQFTKTIIQAINSYECNVTFQVSGDVGSVCKYRLSVVDAMDGATFMLRTTALENGGLITYSLPANGRYSTGFEVETAAGNTQNISKITFTTFDIQNFRAKLNSSAITVTGEFITDSLARGCFIVLQCNESTADIYRAIPRNGVEQTMSETIDVPPSTYTVYAYDIEGNDGLPYTLPANRPQNETITITTGYSEPTPSSAILNKANISVNGSQVTIDCEFSYECPLTSCVLIYREYNNQTLTVTDYNPTTTVFPVTVTVDQPENFTFAIFGRNCEGKLEEKPAMSLKLPATVTTPPDDSSRADVAALVAVTVLVVALVVTSSTVIVVLAMVVKKRGRIVIKGDVYRSLKSNGRGNSNVMPLDEEKGEIRSDSGTQNGAVEEESDTDMRMETEKEEESKYASVAIGLLKNQPQPSLDQAVQYQGIDFKKTKRAAHPHGLYYSDVVPPPPGSQGRNRIIEVDSTPTPYATIRPHTTIPTDNLPHATIPTDSSLSGPPTVEAVMALLWSVAGLWKVIAERLGFDDDLIDEIYTNNETEEACLQDCVEQWMRLGPTWQKLAHVLSDMGQNSLAQQAWSRGKHWSCDDSQCSQPSMATQTTSDGFSTSSQQALKGGNSQIVGGCYGQPYNSIGSDASYRGPMAKLSDDLQEQHRATQASVALQEKASDVTTDISTCVSEEEATESEPTTSEESSEQHDSPVLVGGTAHNISSPAMQTSRCCFEDCHLSDSRKIVDENIEVCGNIQRDESGVSSCKNQGVGVTASTHTKPTRRPQCPDTPSTATTAHKIPVGADNADDGTQSSQLPHTEQFNQVNPPFKRNQWNDPPDARKRRLGGPTCSVSQEAVT